MKDFFISYTGSDVKFATWVAEILEKNKYSVTIQAWDFRPGDNFVSKINEALKECKQLIIILSNKYLESGWCEIEWTSKFAEQVKLKETRIIPIRIEPINTLNQGLFAPVVYIDIVNKPEYEAEDIILAGIKKENERKSDGYPSYFSLEHDEIDIDYFVDDSTITYVKRCKSIVLEPGRNKVHNRITWFRDEEIEIASLTDGVSIELLNMRDTSFNYNVVFDHLLEKNERIEYCVKAKIGNIHHHFENFFSSEIIVPIKSLSIHLSIADPSIHYVYTQKLSSSPRNYRTEKPQEHVFQSPYHWHINNPELNYEYKIYW